MLSLSSLAQAYLRLRVTKRHKVGLISVFLPFFFSSSKLTVSDPLTLKQGVSSETCKGKERAHKDIVSHNPSTCALCLADVQNHLSPMGTVLGPRQMHFHFWRLLEALPVDFHLLGLSASLGGLLGLGPSLPHACCLCSVGDKPWAYRSQHSISLLVVPQRKLTLGPQEGALSYPSHHPQE